MANGQTFGRERAHWSLPQARTPVAGLPLVLWLAAGCGLLAYAGAVWDVAWHRAMGRDTFWSPPHLALYAGIGTSLLAALWGLVDGVRHAQAVRGMRWRIGPYALPVALVLALVGEGGTVAVAPLDDLWHRLYGRDVDVWSFPHLLALATSATGGIGWMAATLPYLRDPTTGRRRMAPTLAYWTFTGLLAYTAWFGLNWYQILAVMRDAVQYPALVGLFILAALLVGGAGGYRWSATTGAGVLLLLIALPIAVFGAIGWPVPAAPPLLLISAVAVDLLGPRLPRRWSAVLRGAALGALFGMVFLAVELPAALALPPAPPATARLEVLVARPYLVLASERPWTLPSVLSGLPVVLVASLGGGLLGTALRGAVRWVAAAGVPQAGEMAPSWPEGLEHSRPAGEAAVGAAGAAR
jgi:hypothetical protein